MVCVVYVCPVPLPGVVGEEDGCNELEVKLGALAGVVNGA